MLDRRAHGSLIKRYQFEFNEWLKKEGFIEGTRVGGT